MGSVSRVVFNADAYTTCLMHALSNDQEEVMGLCIGQCIENNAGYEIHISASLLLRRLDKRKDRVEISVEQLSNASTHAEELACKTGLPLRIVGWYHSHPHITVWPSHVDVKTQAMYQMMDNSFIGIIIACFNEDKKYNQTIELSCFQSTPALTPNQYERIEIPCTISQTESISPACLDTLKELPKILLQEESDAYEATFAHGSDKNSDAIKSLHNASVHVQAICGINESVLLPILYAVESAEKRAQVELSELQKQNKKLKQEILLKQEQHASSV